MQSISLKNYQLRELFQAIKALDGRQEFSKDKDGNVVGTILVPYQFPDYKVIYNVAKTKNAIHQSLASFEEAEKSLQRRYAEATDLTDKTQIDQEYHKLLYDEQQEISYFEIPLTAFDKLNLPPSVMAGLAPIIKE